MQPLTVFTRGDEATEHAEEWQSIVDKAMVLKEDIHHADGTETHKGVSEKIFAAAEEEPRRDVVPEDVHVSVLITCALFPCMNTNYWALSRPKQNEALSCNNRTC